ncbi:MAG: terpene cyclase/mutase family protein [Lachnospiraceae bacterium]|nr:terpene cyclase/mutase family protein [Lachnospiraceae bacterium]
MKRLLSIVLALSLAIVLPQRISAQEISAATLYEIVEGVYEYKCAQCGGDYMSSEEFCVNAGSSANTDWYAFIAGRLGKSGDGYIDALGTYMNKWYSSGRLGTSNPTEWERMSLAVMSLGGDVTHVGVDAEGNSINLIADATFEHDKFMAVEDMLINGLDYALISMDAYDDYVGDDHSDYIDKLLDAILGMELVDGGFALMGGAADVDITAMTVTALSAHMDDERVKACVDRCISWLSEAQRDTGYYMNCGYENAESCAQVVIALSCVGVDAGFDERFIKNGVSVLDALLSFRMEDGGFAHAITESVKSNELATIQSAIAVMAYYRYLNGQGSIYNFEKYDGGLADTDETEPDSSEVFVTVPNGQENVQSEASAETELVYEENTEQLQSVEGEESAGNGNLVYYIVFAVVILGITAMVYMKKHGKVEEE